MKKLIIALAAVLVSVATYAQGQIQLNNRVIGTVDAKVTLPDGTTGVNSDYTAQLVLVSGGSMTPLTPVAAFRDGNGAGYIGPVNPVVTVTGINAGSQASFILRAFDGADWESSLNRGESGQFTVTLGGDPGGGNPPVPTPVLQGLNSFSVQVIPEPSTIALALLGGAALLLRRRK